MLARPCPTRPELLRLLERARGYVMTPEERFEQAVSWVYGEMGLAGSDITKDEVRRHLAAMRGLPAEKAED